MKVRYKLYSRMLWEGKPLWFPFNNVKHQFVQYQNDNEQHARTIEHFHTKGYFVEWEFV